MQQTCLFLRSVDTSGGFHADLHIVSVIFYFFNGSSHGFVLTS